MIPNIHPITGVAYGTGYFKDFSSRENDYFWGALEAKSYPEGFGEKLDHVYEKITKLPRRIPYVVGKTWEQVCIHDTVLPVLKECGICPEELLEAISEDIDLSELYYSSDCGAPYALLDIGEIIRACGTYLSSIDYGAESSRVYINDGENTLDVRLSHEDNSFTVLYSRYVLPCAPCSPCFPNGGYLADYRKDDGSRRVYAYCLPPLQMNSLYPLNTLKGCQNEAY